MTYRPAMEQILDLVREERQRQHRRWGSQRPDWPIWLAILMEEVGEASEAVLKARFDDEPLERVREEMVQVAAVAVAMLEHLDESLGTERRDA